MLIVKSELFGGLGGSPFEEAPHQIVGIERLRVYYDAYVHRLEVTYLLKDGERLVRAYGNAGGHEGPEIVLADDERICGVSVRSGGYVDSLAFVTYRLFNLAGMKKYGPFGGPGGESRTVLSPNIREFFGRSGALLDAIGVRGEEPLLVC